MQEITYKQESGRFCLELDYKQDASNPARIFESFTAFIHAIEQIDRDLSKHLDPELSTELILSDIERGSIRAWFASILRAIPDEAIEELNWKRIIGRYLVKAKYKYLEWAEKYDRVIKLEQIEDLRYELKVLIEELLNEEGATHAQRIVVVEPPPVIIIMNHFEMISNATHYLEEGDVVRYIDEDRVVEVNKKFLITKSDIENLISEQKRTQALPVVMRVKKPDYLGRSQWEFHHDNHTISVKITDQDWLDRFHDREIDLRPGDALKADAYIEGLFDKDGNNIDVTYTLTKIYEVVLCPKDQDLKFDFKMASGE